LLSLGIGIMAVEYGHAECWYVMLFMH